MKIFNEIRKAIFGAKGIFGSVTDFIDKRWPPDMSPEEKVKMEMLLKEFDSEQEKNRQDFQVKMGEITNQAEEQFNQRVKDLEGTVSDLKTVPILGTIVIFIRGALRPAWCLAAMYFDFMLLCGKWSVQLHTSDGGITPEGFMIIIINLLVLGFIFGERTLKNIIPAALPIIELIWGKGKTTKE